MRFRWCLVGIAWLAACGGAGEGGPPPIDMAIDGPDPTVIETRTVAIGPLSVAAGTEQTECIVVDLGNDAPRMVRAVHSALTAGTHHVIATRSTRAPTSAAEPCGPFDGGLDSGVLMLAQQSAASLGYPEGTGLPVNAHQSIHLEMHYVNASDHAMEIGATLTLDLAEATELAPVELLFTGNTSLFIPAHGSITVTSFHPLREGVRLFATTAHTHQWGRRATIALARSATDPDAVVLHDSTDWAERPLDSFAPIAIAAGQGLRLTCSFDNRSDADVSWGVRSSDEMCFLWAHQFTPR